MRNARQCRVPARRHLLLRRAIERLSRFESRYRSGTSTTVGLDLAAPAGKMTG